MRCLVTGATGFIGSNLVHALVERGYSVRALVRRHSDLSAIAGADCECVEGDILDRPSLDRAMRGCDWCFHLAASYSLWLPDYRPMYAANVEGTRCVLESAAAAGCSRIVYTSTVGCIGLPRPGADETLVPSDESTPVAEAQMSNPYKHSKWQAEVVAREFAGRGIPVVIVNPSAPVGPRDSRPTPTGQVIVDFLNGRLPAYLDTGLNWVHVRDVALGHILAAEKGAVGERYILGHRDGNWTMRQTLETLAHLSGRPAPRWRVPYALAYAVAACEAAVARVSGRRPRAPLAGVRMARHKMFFSPAKAIRELGLPQTSPADAFRDAIEWFRANGYVNAPRKAAR